MPIRKKSNLSLNRQRRRKTKVRCIALPTYLNTRKPSVKNFTPEKMSATPSPLKRLNNQSPFHQQRKLDKMNTPSKSPTPKRVKRSLGLSMMPGASGSILGEETDTACSCNDFSFCEIDSATENSSLKDMLDLLPSVQDKLSKTKADTILLEFFRLVESEKFPLNNISFLLWMEVVKWFSVNQVSRMRYSEETKKFWKLGYTLFGGKFIHFMSGYKTIESSHNDDTCSSSTHSPFESEINFAVPDKNILRNFRPYARVSIGDGTVRNPGLLKDMIESLSTAMSNTSCCLTFDGKKLKQGLSPKGGDVDILGFETGPSLSDKQKALEIRLEPVKKMDACLLQYETNMDISRIDANEKRQLVSFQMNTLKVISADVLEIRAIRKKKEYARDRLIERGGETNWKNGKYAYAVSAQIAFLHDIDVYLQTAYQLLDELIKCVGFLHGCVVTAHNSVNLKSVTNYIGLDDVCPANLPKSTRVIKQRTEPWFQARKQAITTGSTLYKAIGLDGLNRQKEYFDSTVCDVPELDHPESVKKAMQYGTENEPNAMATCVGKILPLLYPKEAAYEEGYIELGKSKKGPFIVVSPDGSVRASLEESSTVAGLELKCPLLDVHTRLPERYLIQCLSEIEALNVSELVYVSWRPDISSFFRITKNTPLFERACNLARDVYDVVQPKRPSKLSASGKSLKQDIKTECTDGDSVEFLGIVPSLTHDEKASAVEDNELFRVCRLDMVIKDIETVYQKYHELKREPATEAVVFLCCDLTREWTEDGIRNAPVCWFPKGYSLDTDTMRQVLEWVLDECKASGLHVPAISFDGQWHNICVRNKKGKPLTLLQLQKSVWKTVENLSKADILSAIKSTNIDAKWQIEEHCGQKIYVAGQHGHNLPCISLGLLKHRKREFKKDKLKEKTVTKKSNQTNTVNEITNNTCCGSDITSCETIEMACLDDVMLFNNVEQLNEEHASADDCSSDQCLDHEEVLNDFDQHCDIPVGADVAATVVQGEDVSFISEEQNSCETQTTEADETAKHHYLDDDAIRVILAMLQADAKSNNRNRWTNTSILELRQLICSYDKLKKMRDVELKIVVRYCNKIFSSKTKESCPKYMKLEALSKAMGLNAETEICKTTNRKTRTVKQLKELSFAEVSKTHKKADLNVVYAEYLWPAELEKWRENHPEKDSAPDIVRLYSDGTDDNAINWFYCPDVSESRKQTEVCCVDSSHLLTRTRRKCCKGGLDGLSNEGWRRVAKSNKTRLSLAMVDCVLEPMSVSVARTHFSKSVETELRSIGDDSSAELCSDIRQWWQAEDDRGIAAQDRVKMRMPLRKRLLGSVTFSEFPPPTTHINGWPIQLWEALIANIDAKTLLYSLCLNSTYNVRAFSSMMGETFFAELTSADRRSHGTVTTEEFGQFINNTVDQLHARMDPNRTFAYRTSRRNVYKLVDKCDTEKFKETGPRRSTEDGASLETLGISDHSFDTDTRRSSKCKEASLKCERNAIKRGTLGVRWEGARRNESKLLLTDRLGIEIAKDV